MVTGKSGKVRISYLTNLSISTFSFAGSGLVGLLLVPILLRSLGLNEYGALAIYRLLIPTGILSLFNLGVSEIAAQSVALSRGDGDLVSNKERLKPLVVVALVSGSIVGIIGIGAAKLLSMHLMHSPGIEEAVVIIFSIQPFLFAGLLAEGVAMGHEHYGYQRTVELLTVVSYFATAIVLSHSGSGLPQYCISFACIHLARALLSILHSVRRYWSEIAVVAPDWDWEYSWRRVAVMTPNKWLGSLQSTLAQPIIAIMLDSAAVGVYDVVTKIPKFIKSVLGLSNSVVLPVSARLEGAENRRTYTSFLSSGTLLTFIVGTTAAGLMISHAEPLMTIWLGEDHGLSVISFMIMMIWPVAFTVYGFGGTALLTRPSAVAKMNRLVAYQLIAMYSIGYVLSLVIGVLGFIIAQSASAFVFSLVQYSLVAGELSFRTELHKIMIRTGVIQSMMALGALLVRPEISTGLGLSISSLAFLVGSTIVIVAVAGLSEVREAIATMKAV